MDTMKTCPGCRQPLESNAVDGLCPQCLMQAVLDTGVDVGPDTRAGSGHTPFAVPTLEEIARLFPQLEILELIGQGGMGAVYKARQKELDRVVALKILPPGIGDDPAFAERFAREAKALAKLNHPGIVTLYEFGNVGQASRLSQTSKEIPAETAPQGGDSGGIGTGETPVRLFYFLMEYVDGVSLGQLLRSSRVSPREALAIVPQICDALQYAHDQGIVHRDIKPENILLDRRGRVKVADFGLAKLVGSDVPLTPSLSPSDGERVAARPGEGTPPILTDAGKIMGTPAYMAPEQTEHPSEVDHRADIYSLGVVFYQMLTGELPTGKTFEPPSSRMRGLVVDVRLDEVVLRALEKKPDRRYQQVSILKTQVETIASTASAANPAGKKPMPVLGWRDRWLWERHVIAFGFVPFALLLIVLPLLVSMWGEGAIPVLPLAIAGMGFTGIYAWVGHRIRQLRLALPQSEAEVADAWLAWEKGMWPFNRSQGLAIFHQDRLELLAAWYGSTITVPLADITSVRETRWMYMPLFWKRGFMLHLANGERVGIAVPEPYGRRWRALLSRGRLPELPAASEGRIPNSETVMSGPSRFSRTAIVGACWAALFLVMVLPVVGLHSVVGHYLPLKLLLLLVGTTAPFATTILGCVAVSQIRRSAGRLHGLGLALFDAVLFPLLALDVLIGFFWSWIVYDLIRASIIAAGSPLSALTVLFVKHASEIVMLLTIPVALVLDYLIIRRVWRAVNEPVGGGTEKKAPDTSQAASSKWWVKRNFRVRLLFIIAFLLIMRTFFLGNYRAATDAAAPEIPLGSRFIVWKLSRNFAVGDLIAYRSESRVNVGRVVRDEGAFLVVNRNREADGNVPRANVVGNVITIYWRASDRRPPIPSNTDTARQPSFSPVIERVLTDVEQTNQLLDLDTDKVLSVTGEVRTNTAAALSDWIRSQRVDLFCKVETDRDVDADVDTDRYALAGVGLSLVQAGEEFWSERPPSALPPKLRTGRPGLPTKESLGIRYYCLPRQPNIPSTFVFQTREGGMGVLQIIGVTDNPRGVKIRYKLVAGGPLAMETERRLIEMPDDTPLDVAKLDFAAIERKPSSGPEVVRVPEPGGFFAGSMVMILALVAGLVILVVMVVMIVSMARRTAANKPVAGLTASGEGVPPANSLSNGPDAKASRHGRLALGLCLVGLVFPVAMSALHPLTGMRLDWWIWIGVFALTGLFELPALVMGIIGWKSRAGKAAVMVAVVLPLLLVAGGVILYPALHYSSVRARAAAEKLRVEERHQQLERQAAEDQAIRALLDAGPVPDGMVRSSVLCKEMLHLLAEVFDARQKPGEPLPAEEKKPGVLVQSVRELQTRAPNLLLVTPEQEQQFAAGKFDDALSTKMFGQTLKILKDLGMALPSANRYLIDQFQAGKLSGARLEAARRILAVQVAQSIKEISGTGLANAFEPVRERVLNDLDEGHGNEALHLRTGTLSSVPADAQKDRKVLDAWFKTNRMDLLADYARNRWALFSIGLTLADFPAARWDEATPADLTHALASGTTLDRRERSGQVFFLLPEQPQWPVTFAFKTQEGDQGLLQITGATDNPNGLRIRYKMVITQTGRQNPERE